MDLAEQRPRYSFGRYLAPLIISGNIFSSLDYISEYFAIFPLLLLLVIAHVWSACAGQFTRTSLRNCQPHVQIRAVHTGEIVQQKSLTVSVNGTTTRWFMHWTGTDMVLLLVLLWYHCPTKDSGHISSTCVAPTRGNTSCSHVSSF